MGTMVLPLVAIHMRSDAASAPAKAQQQPQLDWSPGISRKIIGNIPNNHRKKWWQEALFRIEKNEHSAKHPKYLQDINSQLHGFISIHFHIWTSHFWPQSRMSLIILEHSDHCSAESKLSGRSEPPSKRTRSNSPRWMADWMAWPLLANAQSISGGAVQHLNRWLFEQAKDQTSHDQIYCLSLFWWALPAFWHPAISRKNTFLYIIES